MFIARAEARRPAYTHVPIPIQQDLTNGRPIYHRSSQKMAIVTSQKSAMDTAEMCDQPVVSSRRQLSKRITSWHRGTATHRVSVKECHDAVVTNRLYIPPRWFYNVLCQTSSISNVSRYMYMTFYYMLALVDLSAVSDVSTTI